MKTFEAPWGKPLIVLSVLVSVLFLGIGSVLQLLMEGLVDPWTWALLPVVIPLGCLPFVVRGYVIEEGSILVRRLFWYTRLERGPLRSAHVDPEAMKGSIRTFGNGGAYSFTGWYWNKRLGTYRAFVTDLKCCVVLKFGNRTVVVSPDDPQAFVEALDLGAG